MHFIYAPVSLVCYSYVMSIGLGYLLTTYGVLLVSFIALWYRLIDLQAKPATN